MPRSQRLTLACLNIVASPHPPGTYPALLKSMQDIEVSAGGDEKARLLRLRTRKISNEIEVVQGQIFFYTELVRGGAWFDMIAKEPAPAEIISDLKIPENLRPNLKASRFLFDVKHHELFFERRNENGEMFAVSKVKKVFENLAAHDVVSSDFPDVTVTLKPKHDAIKKVLTVPNLKRLVIRLERPNADDIGTQKRRLMNRLIGMNASKYETILTKAKGSEKLLPDEDTVAMAQVAAENGFVHSFGTSVAGFAIERKTSSYPAMYTVELNEGDEPFAKLFEFLRQEAYD